MSKPTEREIAKRAGCAPSLVNRKRQQGKSDTDIIAAAKARRKGKTRKKTESFADAQARKERALADLRETEVRQKQGQLLDLEEVRRAWCGHLIRARDILLAIAPEIRDRIAPMTDPIACGEMIDGEIRRALEELSRYQPAAKSTPAK